MIMTHKMDVLANLSESERYRIVEVEKSEHVDEDRISKLPDDVLLHILSSLPIEKAIQTGVLSRRWKSLWKELPDIMFDDRYHPQLFSDHIIAALVSHQSRRFDSLSIGVSNRCDPIDITIWLAIAFAKRVSKMVLRLTNIPETIALPDGALSRRNTLRVLKVMGNISFKIRLNSVSLGCLKELHLYHVRFSRGSSLPHLLRGCPLLEELVMVIYIRSGVSKLSINSSTMLRLTMGIYECADENIVLDTPQLNHLNIRKFDGVKSFQIVNVSGLVEVKIYGNYFGMDENILSSIISAQTLSLSAPLKIPVAKMYNVLITLEIDTRSDVWCELMSFMLFCSPRLNTLRLIGGWVRRWVRSWVRPDCAPVCLTSVLRTLIWENYTWDAPDDLNVAMYIIANAAQLEKASFTVMRPSTPTRIRERQRFLYQLATVPRASTICELVFEDSSHVIPICIGEDDPDAVGFVRR